MYSIVGTLRYMYFLSIYWVYRMAWNFNLYSSPTIESHLDIEKVFYNEKKSQFTNYLSKVLDNCVLNENIVPIFYDKKAFKEYMQEPKNELERIWKTKILYLNTPRGNIAMFYDSYKLGFSYYSDQNVISYDILNACAMNYVRFYRCLDFFIDESVLTHKKQSPLIELHYIDEEEEKKKVKMAQHKKTILDKIQTNELSKPANPFAHFRNYIKKNEKPSDNQNNLKEMRTLMDILYDLFSSSQTIDNKEGKTNEISDKEKMKNKFVYLGKMHNFQFTQKMAKNRRMLPKFTSPVLDTIVKDAGVQLERMKYSDYKKMMSMIPTE